MGRRILLDPVTGEEINDLYTGRRLEGVERGQLDVLCSLRGG